jgi:hypothetical protein
VEEVRFFYTFRDKNLVTFLIGEIMDLKSNYMLVLVPGCDEYAQHWKCGRHHELEARGK